MDNKTYQLSKLLEGLEMVSTGCSIYMHKKTLEFDLITDENLRIYELFQSDEDSSLLDWEKDMIQKIDDILNVHEQDYLKLPESYEINDHNIMENFAYALPDHLKNEFLSAIFKKKLSDALNNCFFIMVLDNNGLIIKEKRTLISWPTGVKHKV